MRIRDIITTEKESKTESTLLFVLKICFLLFLTISMNTSMQPLYVQYTFSCVALLCGVAFCIVGIMRKYKIWQIILVAIICIIAIGTKAIPLPGLF